jgi:hypothetical protein
MPLIMENFFTSAKGMGGESIHKLTESNKVALFFISLDKAAQ